MTIKKNDAFNAFADGGYYDRKEGRYIHPLWLSEKGERYNTGLSADDYQKIDADTERYLYAPRIRASVFFRMVAERMDIPSEHFNQMGFEPTNSCDPYMGIQESKELRKNGNPDEAELRAKERFYNYMRSHNLYTACLEVVTVVEQELANSWFIAQGIQVVD